jgi:hypothetical protein
MFLAEYSISSSVTTFLATVDYYTRLGRGGLNGASESVLEAITRALRLDEAERAHLFNLARPGSPTDRIVEVS